MQSVSASIHQFYPLVVSLTEKKPEYSTLLKTLKILEAAANLIEAGKAEEFCHFCSEKLGQLTVKQPSSISLNEDSDILADVIRAICDLSVKLFKSMRKPGSPADLDLGTSLARSVYNLDESDTSIYQAFSEWISRFNVPVADLQWKREELLRLAPHLETVNLTDYSDKDSSLSIADFVAACTSVKSLTLFNNALYPALKASLQSLRTVESIQIKRCSIEGEFPELSSCLALKELLFQESKFDLPALDFKKCLQLRSLSLISLSAFNGAIMLPPSLKEFKLDYLPKFNAPLDFSQVPHLERLSLNLLRAMNQPLDLSPLCQLKTLEVKCCDQWEAPLQLPQDCPLIAFDMTEDRKFKSDLSLIANYRTLEKVTLTNCRSLDGTIDFSKLSNLTHLSLKNCLAYTGPVDCSQALRLQEIDVSNCKKIGPVTKPAHL